MNFGKDVSTLKYFTICGLQEGYEPFAVNMNRDVTMWLSKRLPQFVPVPTNHQHIEVHTQDHVLHLVGLSMTLGLRLRSRLNCASDIFQNISE